MARKKGLNNQNRKITRKKIYLFLEGEKNCSEHLYLKKYYDSFGTRAIDVNFYFFPCKGGDWKNIKRTINKEIKKTIPKPEVWCVLDKDQNNLDFIQKECEKEGYKELIFSNISFELWLLYHYCKYSNIGKCDKRNYIKKLEKIKGIKYEKSKGIVVEKAEIKTAVQNSRVKYEMCSKDKIPLNEAYNCTNFYKIIERIDEAFKERKFKS